METAEQGEEFMYLRGDFAGIAQAGMGCKLLSGPGPGDARGGCASAVSAATSAAMVDHTLDRHQSRRRCRQLPANQKPLAHQPEAFSARKKAGKRE
jgi:hypothetical protein